MNDQKLSSRTTNNTPPNDYVALVRPELDKLIKDLDAIIDYGKDSAINNLAHRNRELRISCWVGWVAVAVLTGIILMSL